MQGLGRVLLLNSNYEPLGITDVPHTMVLYFTQKADIVVAFSDKVLHSASQEFPWPSVVKLRNYVRRPHRKVPLTKKVIHIRDRGTCQYCLEKGGYLTVDHVLPVSRGGRDSFENLVTCCKRCNNLKDNMTPEEAGMVLHTVPRKPHHIFMMRQIAKENVNKDWEQYLFS